MLDPVLTSVITCPECGTKTEEEMPTESCRFFWTCPACTSRLRPKAGDCCVFCSYGSVSCPPVQADAKNGCTNDSFSSDETV
jgi:phage terminase large subunit GpA-like protein